MTEKKIDLIAQMLAKAESTTPEEAEALTQAAQKMMAKYLIDQAVIDERRAKKGQESEKIIEQPLYFKGAFRGELLNLAWNVVRNLGDLRGMQNTGYDKGKTFVIWLVGFESDVKQAEVLINSLQLQAAVAVRAWWKENKDNYSWDSAYNQEKARRAFVQGFGTGVGAKLREAKQEAMSTVKTGTELVLVARAEKVQSHMDSKKLGKGRARTATAGGAANGQGYAAGKNANTGSKAVSQGRGIEA
ncbi:hypothetical protein IXEL_54 [Microbacterium phage Ixel]|nr:hypothetical protein IXEL_54 [Microbacterium phage Ixel]